MGKRTSYFYAVRRGRQPGVYNTWLECELQVKGFNNASFKKFPTKEEALQFIHMDGNGNVSKPVYDDAKRKQWDVDNISESPQNGKKFKDHREALDLTDTLNSRESDTVTVYTDGASSSNGFVGCRAGIGVYWGPNHPLNTSSRLPGRQTNNRAEIHAAIHALKQAKEIGAKNVKLHTDSQFLIKGITSWIDNWKKNDWKLKSTGKPVINKDDFMELDSVRQELNVQWIYVKAHDGNDGNIQADQLAVAGTKLPLPKQ